MLIGNDDGVKLWRNGTLSSPGDLLPAVSPWSNLSLVDINDSGAICGTATYTPVSPDDDPIAAGQRAALLLLPVNISLTFSYPTIENGGRDKIEAEMRKQIPGLIRPPTIEGDIRTYFFNGIDSTGKPKIWVVRTSTNQESFVKALERVPYVYYSGHANSGAGFSLKVKAEDPDFSKNSIASIDNFMHLRNSQAAVPWRDFYEDTSEYPNFGPTAIADNQIPASPTNYAVTIPFFPPIVDGYGNINNDRYPNSEGVRAGGTFSLQCTGIDRHHMTAKTDLSDDEPDGSILPFLVVNLDNNLKPKLGYKIFFAAVCNSARDYGEVFNHGCFMSAIGYTSVTYAVPVAFVRALLYGKGIDDIFNDVNKAGSKDFTKSNF